MINNNLVLSDMNKIIFFLTMSVMCIASTMEYNSLKAMENNNINLVEDTMNDLKISPLQIILNSTFNKDSDVQKLDNEKLDHKIIVFVEIILYNILIL